MHFPLDRTPKRRVGVIMGGITGRRPERSWRMIHLSGVGAEYSPDQKDRKGYPLVIRIREVPTQTLCGLSIAEGATPNAYCSLPHTHPEGCKHCLREMKKLLEPRRFAHFRPIRL